MMGGTLARAGLAWLLTYGLHGTITAVVAELLVRAVRPSPADEHLLWRMALVLPLSTAWLAVPFGDRPLLVPALPIVLRIQDSSAIAASLPPARGGWVVLMAAGVAALGVVAGAARFAVRVGRFRRRMADRRPPTDGRLRSSLARLSRRFALGDVELTESAQLASPTAVGTRTICFPPALIAPLADAELDAVIAHELAHLERRDPTWFFCAGLVQAALWMQPFNHRVVARLRRSAEIACDERAVAATGDALGLARALSRSAHAAFGARGWSGVHASLGGAARASNALVDRVRRLAASASAPAVLSSRASAPRFGAAAATLALIAVAGANLAVTLPGRSLRWAADVATEAPAADALDIAAISRRAAYLTAQEIRLETEIGGAQVVVGAASRSAAASRMLELEQDLRHTREERAWLERNVTHPLSP